MIIVNPEFHRYLWLNFSPFRLAIIPIILGIILYIVGDFAGEIWRSGLIVPSIYIYVLVVFIWGNYEAAAASSKDLNTNTWDFQKMSSIGPWQLVFGKLFGSTSYAWYSGILLLCIIAISYDGIEIWKSYENIHDIYETPIKPIIFLVFAGIMGHAVALLFGNQSLRAKKSNTILPFIMGTVTSFIVVYLTIKADLHNGNIQRPDMIWHSFHIDYYLFTMLSLLYFFFWIIVALQRSMRQELQFRNSPIVLMVFLVTLCIYLSGYFNNFPIISKSNIDFIATEKLFLSFYIIIFTGYAYLFTEAGNLAKYKRWYFAIKDKKFLRAIECTPAWVGCVILLLPIYLYINISLLGEGFAPKIYSGNRVFSAFSLTTMFILFAVRDGSIFHSILLGKIEKHKFFMLIIYFVVIYGLLPFTVLSFVNGADEELAFGIMRYFYPIGGSTAMSYLPILIQVGLSALILKYVLKSLKASKAVSES